MAIVVEDGSGKADAVAYASTSDGDAYFAARGSPSAWASASTTAKEIALVAATDHIDRAYGPRFSGDRSTITQRLGWPRAGVERDGIVLDVAPLPRELREACIEAAIRYIQNGAFIVDIDSPGTVIEEEVSVGDLSKRTKYAGGKGVGKQYPIVGYLLGPLLVSSASMERS